MEWSLTLRNVLIGSTLLGLIGGMVGCFAVLRRQSLIGDALAHASLPGIALAFLLTGEKNIFVLTAGALAAGILGSLCIMAITRTTRVKEDAAIGIVLSVFFGAGVVLLTLIQRRPGGHQSGLSDFLFGQAATLLSEDLWMMAILGVILLGLLYSFYKEFKLISFDPGFGQSLGLPVAALELILTTLIVLVVIIGLRTVGVVLMIAALITPAAAARQWTNRLGVMIFLSGSLGALSGIAGALASATWSFPTGPAVVLSSSFLLIVSLLFAPERGLLKSALRDRSFRARIRRENLLKDLYRLGESEKAWNLERSLPEVMGLRGGRTHDVYGCLKQLSQSGLTEWKDDQLRLTDEGILEARKIVRKHRLWEMFLHKRLELPSDHVHRDADAMEHVLSDEATEELDQLLGFPDHDPHGRLIPRETSP